MFAATWICQLAAETADGVSFPAPSNMDGCPGPASFAVFKLGLTGRTRGLAPPCASSCGCGIDTQLGKPSAENRHVKRMLSGVQLATAKGETETAVQPLASSGSHGLPE